MGCSSAPHTSPWRICRGPLEADPEADPEADLGADIEGELWTEYHALKDDGWETIKPFLLEIMGQDRELISGVLWVFTTRAGDTGKCSTRSPSKNGKSSRECT